MTLAGKKLQDIYDSGATMLSSLEKQTIDELEKAKAEHVDSLKQSAEHSSRNLQETAALLQNDFKQSIDESLDKIQNTLILEEAQNKAFVENLLAEMNAVAEQLKLKLKVLKQSHKENVDFAATTAAEQYLNSVEEVRLNLEQAASQAMQGLNVYGRTAWDSLQQTLDQTLLQAGDNANQTTDSFILASRMQAGTVNSHVSGLVKIVSADCQNKLEQIEKSVRDVNDEVESSARTLLETVAGHAATIEQQVNKVYAQVAENHLQSADLRLSNYANNLSVLHDNSTHQLIKATDELSANLLSGSTNAQTQLQKRCDDLIGNVGGLFNTFKKRLEERLLQNRGQKQILENDINRVVDAVQTELVSIRDGFTEKIAALLDNAKSGLTDMTDSVETQMLTTVDTYSEQMNSSAVSIQKQINADVDKFLQELTIVQTAAVNEIAAAAGNTSQNAMSVQTETSTQVENNSLEEPAEEELHQDDDESSEAKAKVRKARKRKGE